MARQGLFKKLFGKFVGTMGKTFTQFRLMNNFIPIFSSFGSEAYKSSVTRAAINAIAMNGAKLKPRHMTKNADGNMEENGNYRYLLSVRPNQFMSAYDFYYKLITQMQNKNNSFALVDRNDNGTLRALYPINFSTVDALEYDKMLFLRFYLLSGEFLTIPYSDCIHLRRHFYDQDIYGENNDALLPTLEVINTMDDGLTNSVKSSANLRGILKSQAMLKDSDIVSQRNNFIESFFGSNNNNGIGALDGKMEFIELKGDPKFIQPTQAKIIEERVFKYFHVNENIVMSKYNENEWNAFYESVLETIAIQLSHEFTHKVLTERQQQLEQEIIFEANRLQYASNQTKINVIKELGALGILTKDEAREIFNLGSSPDGLGDKMIVSLNYVDTTKQNEYQTDGGETDRPEAETEAAE